MSDPKIVIAELQNIQRFFEAKADMSIGNGKMKLLSWANVCGDAVEMLKEPFCECWLDHFRADGERREDDD